MKERFSSSNGDHSAPPGWHYDEETGALMRDVIHRMGRRCRNWDYCGKGVYQITITLADRKSRALGRLCHDSSKGAWVELSEVGRLVEAALGEIARQWPGVEVLGYQVMPDHLHFVVAAHSILQVQCSRSFFAYARDGQGRLLKAAPPRVSSPAFRESCEALLEEAGHGAVEIVYKGVQSEDVENCARASVRR